MSSHRDPPRLRDMGTELPEGLAAALEADLAEFPQSEQLSDLTKRLAPLLGTATLTAAAAIPMGLMAPKAPLTLAGTLKLLAMKWGHTILLPMAIGAASGGVVWEAREYVVSKDDSQPAATSLAQPAQRAAKSLRDRASPQESLVANEGTDPGQAPGAADVETAAPSVRAEAWLAPPRAGARAPSNDLNPPPAVTGAEEVPEFELIDRAQRALARQPAMARRWVDEHLRRFPDGTFVQERETVAIEALVGEGRLVEARARASQFRATFPESAYLRRIDAVLRGPKAREPN
jgi:hypothetical protein